jgi:hypothetical protein
LVQVTVAPTGTVKVSGANAKLVISTASGPCGAGTGVPAPGAGAGMAGIPGIPGIEDMPAIPGVTLTSVANVSEGGAVAASLLPEQPASNSTAAAAGTVASPSFRCWYKPRRDKHCRDKVHLRGWVAIPELWTAYQEIGRWVTPAESQAGSVGSAGANTWITPSVSRTSSFGSGAGEMDS